MVHKENYVSARDDYQRFGHTPFFKTKGTVPDISDICEFPWYSWVYYRDHAASFPYYNERLGRYLGPAEYSVTMMSKWVMNNNGTILPFQTLRYRAERKFCLQRIVLLDLSKIKIIHNNNSHLLNLIVQQNWKSVRHLIQAYADGMVIQ